MDYAGLWYEPNTNDYDDKKNRATALLAETASIETRQSSWHELNLWNATLYSNRELVGFRWGEIMADRELWPTNLRTENIIEEIGEAMLSKASSSPMKPTLVPHGFSLKTERAVRLLDQFLFGVWRQTRAEEACLQIFLDAFISGQGCVRIAYDKSSKQLRVESVFFDNVIIDNRECANRAAPRTYRIRQVLPKAAVEARYGVKLGRQDQYVNYRQLSDGWVVLVEAWRLPDENGEGGYHAVACTDQLLVDDEYTEDYVPLIFFKWADSPSGWFCKSGVEQLVPYQNRQNDLNDAIELSMDLVCRPRLLVNANSMIDINHWDNEAGRMLLWSGVEPKPFDWRMNSLNDLCQERERNKAAAYSHVGMSEMFANADMPQQVRLDSSAGVREFRNMEDARHLRLWTRFEQCRLDVARMILKVLANASGATAFTTTYHPGGTRVPGKTIEWKAVKALQEDQFSWTLEATPLSSMSPAARRELIRDWSSRGLIDTTEARRMEGNTDLERVEANQMAAADDIKRHLQILEGDGYDAPGYEAPTELTDLPNGIPEVVANYKRLLRYEDATKEMLQNHIKWVVAGLALQQSALQAQLAQQQQMVPFAPTAGVPGTQAGKAPAAGQPAGVIQ